MIHELIARLRALSSWKTGALAATVFKGTPTFLLKRIPLYVFPFYLAFAEYWVRQLLAYKVQTTAPEPISVVGPSIVAAGMVLVFPILVPRSSTIPLDTHLQKILKQHNLTVHSKSDQNVASAAWIFLFFATGAWVYSLYLAAINESLYWHKLPVSLPIGGIVYLLGIVFTELKGV